MPRANRNYNEGLVYHITHRCHHRQFFLRFKKDKLLYRLLLFKAVQKYNLSVLDYVITNNHIHLLVVDSGHDVIANSMRYLAGLQAQKFSRRKKLEKGSYWEGRYFATAVQREGYLINCMVYISLNMVRAGVVSHPKFWPFGGYYELHHLRQRYRIINSNLLLDFLNENSLSSFLKNYNDLIEEKIKNKWLHREPKWTEQAAVGDELFLERFK